MNKYDFDFKRIEDVLYDVLGIVNPTDIVSLKIQIRDSLKALSDAIDVKKFPGQEDKVESQKKLLDRELDSIAKEIDLDKVLTKCITIRYLTLLSLEVRVRPEDSYEEIAKKKAKRGKIYALSILLKSTESIVNLMDKRNMLFHYIDTENRIIPVNSEYDEINTSESQHPQDRLDIFLNSEPRSFNYQIDKCLQEAGIYAYDYGCVVYSTDSNEKGEYNKEKSSKRIVGIVKKDEFGEIRKYSVLMDEITANIPPEFFRDILFSDMLLRNAKNNLGFLGVPVELPNDSLYKFKVMFDEENLMDMLRAINFESNPELVSVNTNFERRINVEETLEYIQKKLDQAVQEFLAKKNNINIMGDDREDV